jgi:hypothetical protein
VLKKKYRCTCNEGYTGDGVTCTASLLPCAVDEDCGANAECVSVSAPMSNDIFGPSSLFSSYDSAPTTTSVGIGMRCQCSQVR